MPNKQPDTDVIPDTDINNVTNIKSPENNKIDRHPVSSSSLKNGQNGYGINYVIEDLVLPDEGCCFHCGDPNPNPPFTAFVLGKDREMCCMGCQLAAQSIVEAGLEQYYLDRSEINRTASMPAQLERLEAYDHDEIKSQFVYAAEGKSVAELSVNNLRCAACTWLIESRLYELEGIDKCQVNLTNQRMRVVWDEEILPISKILLTVNQIGYDAKPYRQDTHEAMLARYNKQMMIRLGIAALGAMQAMMFSTGIYFGEYSGMLLQDRDFLRWVSLFVSVPVFFYSAVPFFASAWSAIKIRQVNMDVPVSIALIVTFFSSIYATIIGQGETYFDSVSMLVFFLLAGRYIEHNARLKAANMANDLVVVEPALVSKIDYQPELANYLKKFENGDSQLDDHVYIKSEILEQVNVNSNLQGNLSNNAERNTPQNEKNNYVDNTVFSENSLNQDVLQQLEALAELIHNAKQNKQSQVAEHDAETVNLENDSAKNIAKRNVVEFTGDTTTVTAHSLKIGDVILIEAGTEVVTDGILCSETATVSQSLLTGESNLIVKKRGERVIGGSQNDSQPFVMLVTALPENSQIALIDRLMNRAMSEKPKIAEQADKWARWFVARILLLSVLVFVGWYIYEPSHALWATVAVLVATCPCALSLATPIALTVSTNRLASYGFLTTRGHTIETLSEITHIAFDKTGTLTYGKPNLLFIETLIDVTNSGDISSDTVLRSNKSDKDKLLAIAAALEVGSRHPIASAILDAAYQLHLPNISNLKHYPAGGVEAQIIDGNNSNLVTTYRLGHVDFALQTREADLIPDLVTHNASSAIMLSQYVSTKQKVEKGSEGQVWQPLAFFYFNDSIRDGAKQMIDSLKSLNIETIMLTGDPSEHGNKVAKTLGIAKMYKGLSPTQKVNHIKSLQEQGHIVMMVGDGINDAPVLAAANVSTAIAGAADLAQVSSDSIILNGAIHAVYDAKRVADKAHKIIKENLRWALAYNAIVLLPAVFGYVPPWLAAIGMSLSSLVVVLNALRLKRA